MNTLTRDCNFKIADSNVFYVPWEMAANPPRRGLNISARGRAESPGRRSAAPGTYGFKTVALKGPNKWRCPCFALSGLGFTTDATNPGRRHARKARVAFPWAIMFGPFGAMGHRT